MIFTDKELQYLSTQLLGRLASVQPDGTLQINPVGFAWNAERGTFDIGGRDMGSSRKFRNVRSNERVAFVVDDLPSRDPWTVRCLEIRGTGEAIEKPTDSVSQIAGAIIRVHPHRIISFGVDPAAGNRDV